MSQTRRNDRRAVQGAANAPETTPERQSGILAGATVRVMVGGKVERVSAQRAARLLVSRQAELVADVTQTEAAAILAAAEEREERAAAVLAGDGLLIGGEYDRPPAGPDRFRQGPGPMARLNGRW
jgi:hypothetical protein